MNEKPTCTYCGCELYLVYPIWHCPYCGVLAPNNKYNEISKGDTNE